MKTVSGPLARSHAKSILVGSIGNLVEWYDWYIYPNFALYFAKAFFPAGDQTAQLLNSASVFAVGFLMRPIGGWLLGRYADRAGRRPALILSMLLMAAGSAGVGLIPGYAAIGFLAPLLLVLSRVVQGFSVGGQYAASASYLSEIAKRGNRGFWTSFHYVTLLCGLMLAQVILFALQHLLLPQQISGWAWRIPFFIGALLAIGALLISLTVEESPSFEKLEGNKRPRNDISQLWNHWRSFTTVFAITVAGTISFQTYATYMPQYLVNTAGFTPVQSTEITMAAVFTYTLLHPLLGWLSDLFGRKPLLIVFAAGGLICTFPVMSSLATAKDSQTAFWLLLTGLALLTPYTAVSAIFKAELFPTEIRAMAVGLSFALPISIFGGTLPSVALYFKAQGHEAWYYWYITGSFALALIAALFLPKPLGRETDTAH